MSQVQKNSHVAVVVDAPVEDVWRVVADVSAHRRVEPRVPVGASGRAAPSRLLPERASAVATGPAGHGGPGRCEIVAVDDRRELVWRTIPTLLFPDSTEWRIHLEPTGDGTTITQSFTVVRAPWLLDRLYARLIPSHQDRDARLAEDLARIGATARQAG